MELIIITFFILLLCVGGISMKILLKKGGKFNGTCSTNKKCDICENNKKCY